MAVAPTVVDHQNATERKKAERIARRDEEKKDLDSQRREEAATIAADMEMGYYEPMDGGEQWNAKPFVVAEILRRMGYGKWTITNGRRPRWWPGLEVFRKLVAWKVAMRKMQQQVDFSNKNSWAGPIVGLAVEEMGERLSKHPETVSDRDLTDLITKLTKLFVEGRPSSAPPPDQGSAAARFTRVTEIFELPDDPRAGEKMRRDYEGALERARLAIPARATPEP